MSKHCFYTCDICGDNIGTDDPTHVGAITLKYIGQFLTDRSVDVCQECTDLMNSIMNNGWGEVEKFLHDKM